MKNTQQSKHLIEEDQMRKKKRHRTFFQFNSKLFSISRLKKRGGGGWPILAVPTTPNNSESTSFFD